MPGAPRTKRRQSTTPDRDISEERVEWEPEEQAEQAIVHFESDPPGAIVMVDGQLSCQSTAGGCSRALTVGRHEVAMLFERYEGRRETVRIQADMKIAWTLTPKFGWLSVTSTQRSSSSHCRQGRRPDAHRAT